MKLKFDVKDMKQMRTARVCKIHVNDGVLRAEI